MKTLATDSCNKYGIWYFQTRLFLRDADSTLRQFLTLDYQIQNQL